MAKAVIDLSGGLVDFVLEGQKLIYKTTYDLTKAIRTEYMKYLKDVKEELTYECRTCIDTFYESYPRGKLLSYDRLGDLYNTFEVFANEEKVGVRFDASFMQYEHHQSNEFIFENSFMNGYHGGSIGTDKRGISVNRPFYRTPPHFKSWFYLAAKTRSPYEMISMMAEHILDVEQAKLDKNIRKAIEPSITKMIEYFDKL